MEGLSSDLAPLTGPYHPVAECHKAVGKGILKAGVLTAPLTFQEPVPLVGFLKGFVDPIVG